MKKMLFLFLFLFYSNTLMCSVKMRYLDKKSSFIAEIYYGLSSNIIYASRKPATGINVKSVLLLSKDLKSFCYIQCDFAKKCLGHASEFSSILGAGKRTFVDIEYENGTTTQSIVYFNDSILLDGKHKIFISENLSNVHNIGIPFPGELHSSNVCISAQVGYSIHEFSKETNIYNEDIYAINHFHFSLNTYVQFEAASIIHHTNYGNIKERCFVLSTTESTHKIKNISPTTIYSLGSVFHQVFSLGYNLECILYNSSFSIHIKVGNVYHLNIFKSTTTSSHILLSFTEQTQSDKSSVETKLKTNYKKQKEQEYKHSLPKRTSLNLSINIYSYLNDTIRIAFSKDIMFPFLFLKKKTESSNIPLFLDDAYIKVFVGVQIIIL